MMCMIHVGFAFPFDSQTLNVVELMNEGFIMLTVYLMHLFSDFVPNAL